MKRSVYHQILGCLVEAGRVDLSRALANRVREALDKRDSSYKALDAAKNRLSQNKEDVRNAIEYLKNSGWKEYKHKGIGTHFINRKSGDAYYLSHDGQLHYYPKDRALEDSKVLDKKTSTNRPLRFLK